MRLFGHADVEHGMLPGFPRLPFTKIRPVPYSSGSRRGSQPPVSRPRAPRQHLAAIPSALLAGAQPEGKCLARNPREIFKNYALKSIDAVRAKLEQAILYLEHNPDIVKSITGFPYVFALIVVSLSRDRLRNEIKRKNALFPSLSTAKFPNPRKAVSAANA